MPISFLVTGLGLDKPIAIPREGRANGVLALGIKFYSVMFKKKNLTFLVSFYRINNIYFAKLNKMLNQCHLLIIY